MIDQRLVAVLFSLWALVPASGQTPETAPVLMRDFMGINAHTVRFNPEQYAPTGRLARDYHPVDWDFGDSTQNPLTLPRAANGVHWESLYRKWIGHGYQVHLTAMFVRIKPEDWHDLEQDAYRYGKKLAETVGPKAGLGPGRSALATSVGIGNENGAYTDEQYRRVFDAMSQGLRAGDPDLKIATAAATAGPSTKYYRALETFRGLEDRVDVITCHSYAMLEGWPTWRRSYPEDPATDFLQHVRNIMHWRDQHLPGKPVWVCEFGWDATTQDNNPEGTFARWEGNSDLEQAQWLVRGYLLFRQMGVDRAYLYFFNDEDQPTLHAASGLTRNGEPKASFWAVGHLQQVLGDYRLVESVLGDEHTPCYRFTFEHEEDTDRRVIVIWSPTGDQQAIDLHLDTPGFTATRAERMPIQPGDAPPVALTPAQNAQGVQLTAEESPTYVFLRRTN